jgi:predicted transcriptional regulator
MTILVELIPEVEASLKAEAALHGMDLQKYAGKLLEGAAIPRPAETGTLTREEFHTMLRELAEGSEALPKLPTSAFSRESIYEDHL